MSRAASDQIQQTSSAQNAQQNQNAQQAVQGAQSSMAAQQGDIGDYQAQLSQFAAANPYGQGGAFQTAENQSTSNTADAASQAAAQQAQGAAVRGGLNAGAATAAGQATNQANTRNIMQTQAQQNAGRISQGAGYGQQVLNASQVPATLQAALTGEQDKLAGTESNAANQAEDTSQKAAAASPSFLDELMQGTMSAGAAFAGGAGQALCPAIGTLYLMGDGTEKPVETLIVGEYLAGIDGEKVLIEDIQSAQSLTLIIRTDDGYTLKCSRVHAFAQPIGGFVVAMHAMGKTVLTSHGRSKVIGVETSGYDEVFNVITDGSHTYRADGMWSLGVGEAERQVSMKRWGEIGDHMEKEAVTHGKR